MARNRPQMLIRPVGQKRRFDRRPVTSGLPLPDIFSAGWHVSNVPEADSCTAANGIFIHLVGAGELTGYRFVGAKPTVRPGNPATSE